MIGAIVRKVIFLISKKIYLILKSSLKFNLAFKSIYSIKMDFLSNKKQSEYIKSHQMQNYIKGKTNLLWKDWWKQRIWNLKTTNRDCKQKKRNVNTSFYFILNFPRERLPIFLCVISKWMIDSVWLRTNIIHSWNICPTLSSHQGSAGPEMMTGPWVASFLNLRYL